MNDFSSMVPQGVENYLSDDTRKQRRHVEILLHELRFAHKLLAKIGRETGKGPYRFTGQENP